MSMERYASHAVGPLLRGPELGKASPICARLAIAVIGASTMNERARWFAGLAADAQMATPADAEAAIPNTSCKPPLVDLTIVKASGRTRLWFSNWKRRRPAACVWRSPHADHGRLIAPAGPLSACYSSQSTTASRPALWGRR